MVVSSGLRMCSDTPHLVHTGTAAPVLLDLDAPPLVVGEVPVKAVQLMERQQIDELLHELPGHEVARRIKMSAAPGEPGDVLDRDSGSGPRDALHLRLAQDLCGQELP